MELDELPAPLAPKSQAAGSILSKGEVGWAGACGSSMSGRGLAVVEEALYSAVSNEDRYASASMPSCSVRAAAETYPACAAVPHTSIVVVMAAIASTNCRRDAPTVISLAFAWGVEIVAVQES